MTENDCEFVKQLSSISIDTKDGLSVKRTILVLVKQLDPIVTVFRDVKLLILSSDTDLKQLLSILIVWRAGLLEI